MKTPAREVERAKALLEDYKKRASRGEHFKTWEEVEKDLSFTPEEKMEIEKEEQKILSKINKKRARLAKRVERQTNKRFVKV